MEKPKDKTVVVAPMKINLAKNTHIYNEHSLIQAKISVLRDENTPSSIFRKVVEEITILLASDALSHLPLEDISVTTPICKTTGSKIAGKKMVLVPIIRAGLAMEPAMKAVVPQARTGFCGVYRDPDTSKPVPYYWKMPDDIGNRSVFILDPMLATGGSMLYTIDRLKKEHHCKSIHLMSIIAAPEGVDLIQTLHPDVEMYIAQLDEGLNCDRYIVPGLGDAGDRIYGTK